MINVQKSLRSFKFATNGIIQFFKLENNARVHLLAALIVLALGWYFQFQTSEWLWITVAVALVWITEALNTAIEQLVDLVSPDFNERAGKVKDLAAAAVLFAAITSVIIALFIFGPHFLRLF